MNVKMVLMVLALVCFFFAAVDWPTGVAGRLVAAGLFLVTLASML